MDLSTHALPARFEVYEGDVKDLKLAFSREPFVTPNGKFVNLYEPGSGKAPAFLLRDVTVPYDWQAKFRTLSVPAGPGTVALDIVDRVATLVDRANLANAQGWYGKDEAIVEAAVSVKTGLRASPAGTMLTLKAPGGETDPEFYDVRGQLAEGPVPLRNAVCDVLLTLNGLFVRGLECYCQWKVHAIVSTT